MPDRSSFDKNDVSTVEPPQSNKSRVWDRFPFSKLGNWRKKEESDRQRELLQHGPIGEDVHCKAVSDWGPTKTVIPELPRPATFRRQDSEKRERLLPQEPCVAERRTLSTGRRRAASALRPARTKSPLQPNALRRSAPVTPSSIDGMFMAPSQQPPSDQIDNAGDQRDQERPVEELEDEESAAPRTTSQNDVMSDLESATDPLNDPEFREELARRWILNLSMHFRDRSEREKFIVTFAEWPTKWRRVTVSCDYRNAEPDSLESNLKELGYQRDKNAYIYDAIRESLSDIKFYDTVTNLKLETREKRLHVHVTEDVNEIISYPSLSAIQHLNLRADDRLLESSIRFEGHQSGFVYKVSVRGRYYIKKEIPSPDTVDEFLYEINALTALRSSNHVIRFCGVVVDNDERLIKGLLIDYAEQGALVDLIFDHEKVPLPWVRREKWAKQIIEGLQDIHEYGFVQGDFTLSNIVIDSNDNAKIIDINRRGCPVGWEPPEFIGLINSGQRVSMYIGIKSDLFQLGMVLWGLAMLCDEPEREEGPLSLGPHNSNVPEYFRELVNSCLSENPTHRMSARELLLRFPRDVGETTHEGVHSMLNGITHVPARYSRNSNLSERSEDVEEHRRLHPGHAWDSSSHMDGSYFDAPRANSRIDISVTAAGSHLETQVGTGEGHRPPVPDILILDEPSGLSLDDEDGGAPTGLPFLDRSPPEGVDMLPVDFEHRHQQAVPSDVAVGGTENSAAAKEGHGALPVELNEDSRHDQAQTFLSDLTADGEGTTRLEANDLPSNEPATGSEYYKQAPGQNFGSRIMDSRTHARLDAPDDQADLQDLGISPSKEDIRNEEKPDETTEDANYSYVRTNRTGLLDDEQERNNEFHPPMHQDSGFHDLLPSDVHNLTDTVKTLPDQSHEGRNHITNPMGHCRPPSSLPHFLAQRDEVSGLCDKDVEQLRDVGNSANVADQVSLNLDSTGSALP